jgi:hypothetical protein
MIRVRRRVEKLEHALVPEVQAEPQVILVQYVNVEREVVDSFSVQLARPVRGGNRRGRRADRWAGRRWL